MSSSSIPSIDWVAVGALGTLAAAVVALFVAFLPSLLGKWNRPKPDIQFQNEVPYSRYSRTAIKYVVQGNDENIIEKSGWAYWVRLRIQNTGKSVMQACEGRLDQITDNTTHETEHRDFDPVVLHWVGHTKGPLDINRNEYEYLDVFFLFEHEPSKYIIRTEDWDPRGIILNRDKKKVGLDITIYGRNINPKPFHLDVEFDKLWYQCNINGKPNAEGPPVESGLIVVQTPENTTASVDSTVSSEKS